MKGYTSETKVENYILQNIDSTFSSQIEKWIEAAEAYIDNLTGRNFIADSSASARLYDGDDSPELLIDDAVEVTKVEVGQDDYGSSFEEVSASGSDRYFLEPANYSADSVPIMKIVLRARNFPEGHQNNRITAKWGYSASVPADIEFAATVLVAGICNAQRKDTKEIASEKIGNYSVSYASEKEKNDFEQAKNILDKYVKFRL